MAKFIKVHMILYDKDFIPVKKYEIPINVDKISSFRAFMPEHDINPEYADSQRVNIESRYHKSLIRMDNNDIFTTTETVSEIENLISKPSECGKSFTSD